MDLVKSQIYIFLHNHSYFYLPLFGLGLHIDELSFGFYMVLKLGLNKIRQNNHWPMLLSFLRTIKTFKLRVFHRFGKRGPEGFELSRISQ